jgi:AcrR family transcriptional regulator
MRITAEAKTATRQRILEVAEELFRTKGFEATTTRDIAQASEIATGTLFNYFATKEAIVTELAAESLERARGEFDKHAGETETLEEALFARVAVELRQLRPFRKYIVPMLETAFCPLAAAERNGPGEELRRQHLEEVGRLARRYGLAELSPVALQLYWTLYTGVLTFWAADRSSKQEDTLALLDQSLAMFVAWLRTGAVEKR